MIYLKRRKPIKPENDIINPQGTNSVTVRIRKRHKQTFLGKILIALLILLVILLASGVLKSIITRFMISVIPVETTVLEDKIVTEFLFIRQETAIPAPFAGRFEEIIHDGERVAKNTAIGYLIKNIGSSLEATEKVPVLSPQAGILSYMIDGYESILTPQVWPQLDLTKLPDLKKEVGKKTITQVIGSKTLVAGEHFYKIVDNLVPCNLYAEAVTNLPENFTKGNSIDIRIAELENLAVKGKIVDLIQTDEESRILFSIPYVTGIENIRFTNGAIVVGKYSGMVVDKKVLVNKDEAIGVYLLRNGNVFWLPVNVAATAGDKAVLGGLSSSDWIIVTPGLVKEGQRVFSRH